MTRTTLLIALLVMTIAENPVAAQQPVTAGRPCVEAVSAIRRAVSDVHARQRNIGLSYAVYHRGTMIASDAIGMADVEHDVKASPATVYGIASITKAFTGAALLKLVERGLIDLDAPIQRYVQGFPEKPQGVITVRMLAAHFGGIRHWANERTPATYARRFTRAVDLLPFFANDTLVAVPGTRYSYTSHGYNLLAAAIESVSGQAYPEFVKREIIEPLGLASTGFDQPLQPQKHRSERYSYFNLTSFAESDTLWLVPRWDYTHNMAGGGLSSTAEDLVKFGRAFLRPGLLNASSLAIIARRPRFAGGVSTATFGWFATPDTAAVRVLNMTGSNPGVQAGLYVYPDDDLVVSVLSNTWGRGARGGDMVFLPGVMGRLCLGAAQ